MIWGWKGMTLRIKREWMMIKGKREDDDRGGREKMKGVLCSKRCLIVKEKRRRGEDHWKSSSGKWRAILSFAFFEKGTKMREKREASRVLVS